MRRSRLRQLRRGLGLRLADIPEAKAAERRLQVAVSIPALTTGLDIYTMGPPADDLIRVSSILDYLGDPTAWSDGRTLVCEHQRGNSTCGVKFNLLSNHHFKEETERLRSQNGVLTGPSC